MNFSLLRFRHYTKIGLGNFIFHLFIIPKNDKPTSITILDWYDIYEWVVASYV